MKLSYTEIERIIGSKLPVSAYKYNAWWSNDMTSGSRQCRAWLDIGWRTANIELGKSITFSKEWSTYLLTWNPNKWEWTDINDAIKSFKATGNLVDRWSYGNTKKISPGDRLFLIRQSKEPKGIFASGWATSGCIQDEHWDEEKANQGILAKYVTIKYDVLLNPFTDRILSRLELNEGMLGNMHWSTQPSGISIPRDISAELERKWAEVVMSYWKDTIPEEVNERTVFKEGAVTTISVNAYERNADARKKCIQHYGYRCFACGILLAEIYGERAKEFIHIHHTVPLADIGEEYAVDPIKDLKPLCPNCHAVIHRSRIAISIEDLKRIIYETKTLNSEE